MNGDLLPPGSVSHDNPAVVRVMAAIDGLRPSEWGALLCDAYRAALNFKRMGNVDHLVEFAKNLIATVHLRGVPAYVEALENAPPHRSGSGGPADVDEVVRVPLE